MATSLADYVEIRRSMVESEELRRAAIRRHTFDLTLRRAQEAVDASYRRLQSLMDEEIANRNRDPAHGLSLVLSSRGVPHGLSGIIGRIGAAAGVTVTVPPSAAEVALSNSISTAFATSLRLEQSVSGFRDGFNARAEVMDVASRFKPSNEAVESLAHDVISESQALSDRATVARERLLASLIDEGVPPNCAERRLIVADDVAHIRDDRQRVEALNSVEIAAEPFIGTPTGTVAQYGEERFALVRRESDNRVVLVPEDVSMPSRLSNEPLRFWPNTIGDFHVSLASEETPEQAIAYDLSGPSSGVLERLVRRAEAIEKRQELTQNLRDARAIGGR